MVKGTLNELSQLRDSEFGQPQPRHGLNLLYWFAHDYIQISNGIIYQNFNPKGGAFGFHKFLNRIEDDECLLPNQNQSCFEVGNLHYEGADKLPDYVRKYGRGPDSNKDRIIVSLDTSGNIQRVYITEHSDAKRFDNSKTFRVSQGLLKIIKNLNREQYLNLVLKPQYQVINQARIVNQNQFERPPENNSWCTIL